MTSISIDPTTFTLKIFEIQDCPLNTTKACPGNITHTYSLLPVIPLILGGRDYISIYILFVYYLHSNDRKWNYNNLCLSASGPESPLRTERWKTKTAVITRGHTASPSSNSSSQSSWSSGGLCYLRSGLFQSLRWPRWVFGHLGSGGREGGGEREGESGIS